MDLQLYNYNTLEAYVQEVKKFPLLTAEEEKQTAIEYYTTKSLEAAHRLVVSNLRYVVKIANKFKSIYNNVIDLIQEGNVGLCLAIKNYDPTKGRRFILYAAWWIRAYIRNFLMKNRRIVSMDKGKNSRKLYSNLYGRLEENPHDLAIEFNIPEKEIIEMQVLLGRRDFELDAPVKYEYELTGETHMALLPAHEDSPEDAAIKNEIMEKLNEFKNSLDEKRRFILENRMMSDNPMSLQEVGNVYGFSRERARQLEEDVLLRIKNQNWF